MSETTTGQEFIVALSGGPQKVRFPGFDPEYYFEIDDGGDNLPEPEPEIELAEAVTDEETGELDLKRSRLVMRVSGNQFVERCVAQVRDFRLPVSEDGKVEIRTFSKNSQGDNKHNREIYRSLRDTDACKFRSILLGAMDRLAGRDTPFRESFEELFAEHPSLLSDS